MSVEWFIERASFWFAEDNGCADRKIAVGRGLPEQQNAEIYWILPGSLSGSKGGWAYYRNPYDANCELDFDHRFYADQLTRPHDPGPRVDGVRPGEGYYLDLVDDARAGPAMNAATKVVRKPVYVESTDEGDSRIRLTYWTLFGMDGQANAHEGDWQRFDVLLSDLGDDRYAPIGAQSVAPHGPSRPDASDRRETPWASMRRVDGTHPVVRLARGTHEPTAVRTGDGCAACFRWETWNVLTNARKEPWYGFGGAWGEPGASSATTGPLGPHGFFPGVSEKAGEVAG
jgi:hypothetical protein